VVKAMVEATKDMRVYCMVDRSGSMQGALDQAKAYLKRLLVGFPLERLHVSVFESRGKKIEIKANKAAAVEQAFRGITAAGGTSHSAGLRVLSFDMPKEGEDVLMLWIGDQQGESGESLAQTVRQSAMNPVAFGLLHIDAWGWGGRGTTVVDAAKALNIPCFNIDPEMFSDDPYAVTRTLQRLISSTPVGKTPEGRVKTKRVTLVETILKTDVLTLPVWVVKAA